MAEQKIAEESDQISHMIYERTDKNHADACAWVFTSESHFEPYYYKHPDLNPNELRARVLYSSLCQSDILTVRGKWGPCNYPLCPGHEVVAEVTAVGSEVASFKPGDKVMWGPIRDSCGNCDLCKQGQTSLCYKIDDFEKFLYGFYWGGYSTHIQQPESHCFKVPESLSLETAAPLMCSGVTVFRPLARHCKKGDKIGIVGAGGLGHLAAQFAAKMGMKVDIFTHSNCPEKMQLLKSIGVENFVNWNEDKSVKNLEKEYDAIVSTIPVGIDCEKMDLLINTLKPNGKLILLSMPPEEQKFIASYFPITTNAIQVIGSATGGRIDTENMLAFASGNKIEPICEFYDFWEFPKALEKIEKGIPKFKCVLCIDQESKKYK